MHLIVYVSVPRYMASAPGCCSAEATAVREAARPIRGIFGTLQISGFEPRPESGVLRAGLRLSKLGYTGSLESVPEALDYLKLSSATPEPYRLRISSDKDLLVSSNPSTKELANGKEVHRLRDHAYKRVEGRHQLRKGCDFHLSQ